MEYRRFDNTIVARIDRGEEVLEQVAAIAQAEQIKLASVQALGATRPKSSTTRTPSRAILRLSR